MQVVRFDLEVLLRVYILVLLVLYNVSSVCKSLLEVPLEVWDETRTLSLSP